jgi:hypothetical protein
VLWVRSLFDVGGIGDRVCGGEGRSLVDLRFRRSGFVGSEGRSLVDVGNRRSGLGVLMGNRCLMCGEAIGFYGW